jgi:hypothetical protein
MVLASLSPVFTLVVRQSAYFHRAFSDAPRWWGYSPFQRHASALMLTLPLHFGIPKEWWREWFAVPGPIAVGGTAWAHASMQTSAAPRPGAAPGAIQPPRRATTAGGEHARPSSLGYHGLDVGPSLLVARHRRPLARFGRQDDRFGRRQSCGLRPMRRRLPLRSGPAAFPHARFPFSSPGMRGFLYEPPARWHIS